MSSGSGLDSWYHEKESAWLYRQLAAAEADPAKSALFLKLAVAADEQAAKWQLAARRARNAANAERTFQPALRARIVARLLKRFEPRALRPVLAAMKLRGLSIYSAPIGVGHPMPTSLEQVGARHRSVLGGSLRAAVFGVNDGLVSNVSLVLGVAGALSMAAGEYVSVRSQREMYEYQIALEREELAEYPEEEAEELALIYQARGVELAQARELSRALLSSPQAALDVLAREELGLNPDDLGSPWQAATVSFVAFALGAAVPLVPFLAGMHAMRATLSAAVVTLMALFVVGLSLSLFTGRQAVRSAVRMVLIGGGAGAVCFLLGRALGVALS